MMMYFVDLTVNIFLIYKQSFHLIQLISDVF